MQLFFNFCVLLFLHRVFYYLRLLLLGRIWAVTMLECSIPWSFFLFFPPHPFLFSSKNERFSSGSPHCTEQAFGAAWMDAMNVWETSRWETRTHTEIAYKGKELYILRKRMLVVRAVGIHKLQEHNASRTSHSGFIVDLSFFFLIPLKVTSNISCFSGVPWSVVSPVIAKHDWPNFSSFEPLLKETLNANIKSS